MPAILAGIGWHMVGAASAASFYAPIGKVKKWSWETTWAVAGFFSWILLPISVSLLLLPGFQAFYGSIDTSVLLKVAFFGAMWGIGNVSYGLTMRHLGMSLGIGVAIGVTLMVGTLMPPLLHGQFVELFTTKSGLFTMAGVVVALIGVATVSYAGHQKEMQLRGASREFNLKLGIALAVMCGVFSSGMSFAIDAAKPMEAAALHLGVNPLYAALPSYVIIMGGGALVNLSYCFIRLAALKRISLRDDLSQSRGTLLKNGALAATGGIMWYFQFFFYAWGAANIPQHLSYVNWMLHMSGYVLCGGLVLVVGSTNSSNSNRLVEVSRNLGTIGYLIDNSQAIDPKWLEGVKNVAVTAGASAPEVLVEDVVNYLRQNGFDNVEEVEVMPENVRFGLPPEIVQAIGNAGGTEHLPVR